MRVLANLLVQFALIVGILLIARLVFDLSLGGVLAGCGAGLGIAVTQYVRARRATRATVRGDGRRRPEG